MDSDYRTDIELGLTEPDMDNDNNGGRLIYFSLNDSIDRISGVGRDDNLYEIPEKQFICKSNGIYSIDISGYLDRKKCNVYKKTTVMVNGIPISPTYELATNRFMSSGPGGRFYYSYQLGLKKGDVISFKHVGYEYEGYLYCNNAKSDAMGTITHDDKYIRVQGTPYNSNSSDPGDFVYGFGIIPWYYALSYDENRQIATTPTSAVDSFEVIG